MRLKILISILLLSMGIAKLRAMEIKGTIQLQDDWHPVVYLASLNSPENLFVASPEFVIAETFIQPDGSFSIRTTSVPDDLRFYRLYLVKGENSSVEFNTSTHRNYIHLLLQHDSEMEISASVENNTLKITRMTGSEESEQILRFDQEMAQRKIALSEDITKAKRDFLTQDKQKYIRNFVSQIPNSLVGLYALYHLEDKDTDFLRNSDFYFGFQKKLGKQFPNSYYAELYSELLASLVGFRDMVCEIPGVQPQWKDNLLIAQSIAILLLLIALFLLLFRHKNQQNGRDEDRRKELFLSLTSKQQEILMLLAAGKSNKEIAQALFIELSTVKTHINSIYKQLKLSDRKAAVDFYQSVRDRL